MVRLDPGWRTSSRVRRARGLWACTASSIALGCGIVEDHATTSHGAPSLGTGGSASDVGTGSAAIGGDAGDSLSNGTQDAGAACRATDDAARIEVERSLGGDGGIPLPGAPGRVDQSLTGLIHSVDHSTFTLAHCDLVACDGLVWTVTIDAPGLDLRGTLWPGFDARVHYVRAPSASGSVATEILVTNPALAPDPSSTTVGALYVAADVGGDVIPEAPYTVSYLDAHCPVAACPGDSPALSVDRALTVEIPMGSAGTFAAAMGQTSMLYGTNGRLTLRNLRSVDDDRCDGTSSRDSSYWITNQPYRE
jgi:hypothetical protein